MKIGKTIRPIPFDIASMNEEDLQVVDGKEKRIRNVLYSFEKLKTRERIHRGRISDFCVYIDVMAWDSFLDFANQAHQSKRHEACGIIMGRYFKDQYGEFIVASQFEPGTGDSTSAVLCEISYADNARISKDYENTDFLPVVWIHSHPGYGIFYSGQDYQTLRESYSEKFHAGIVVDNLKEDFGTFKMIAGQPERIDDVFLIDLTSSDYSCFKPFSKRKKVSETNTNTDATSSKEEQEENNNGDESVGSNKSIIIDLDKPNNNTMFQSFKNADRKFKITKFHLWVLLTTVQVFTVGLLLYFYWLNSKSLLK